MGYYLYDARGYVGDLASIHGLQQLSEYVGRTSQVPLVKKFFREGQALVTEDLIAGFRSLHPEDIDVTKTIDNLLQLLVKCDSIAIISDGVGVECPELTIHRGTHEIGGSCIELCSSSGNTRIILDIGLPLVNKDMSPFDWNAHRKLTLPELPSAHAEIVRLMIDSIETGSYHLLDASSARATLEVIMAFYESSRRRSVIQLPLDVKENPLFEMIESGEA